HAKAGGAASDRATDATETDEAERGRVHVDTEEVADVEAGPATAAQVGLGVGGAARRGEEQQEGEVGGGLVEHTRRVAHRDAEVACGGDVDVVVAHRHVGNDL